MLICLFWTKNIVIVSQKYSIYLYLDINKVDDELNNDSFINIYEDDSKVDFDLKRRDVFKYNSYGCRSVITMDMLKAINKKCEELGWLKEVEE